MSLDDRAARHEPRRRSPGFTLIEILVVVVIIGVLASVAVFAVRSITDRGQDASCASDAQVLLTASDSYMAINSVDVLPGTGTDADRFERTLVDAGLLQSVSTYYVLDEQGRVSTSGEPCT